MADTTAMESVSLHYWAGAKAAAGTAAETVRAETVAQALDVACQRRSDPRFDRVVRASALLINGVTARAEDLTRTLTGPVEVEVLPPFAGGSAFVTVHLST
jgi:molybdopterin synthase sulfur carrier subunit